MYKIIKAIGHRSSFIRQLSARYFYQYVSRVDKRGDVTFMNFGYANLDPDAQSIPLAAEDEDNRYPLQLYHHIASAVDLKGLDVLEVGSGRGGGAAYVKRNLAPKSMTGVDLSTRAIAFSQQEHGENGLRYLPGDAEDLPLEDHSFDVAINIESSHCYGDMRRFLREVHRILRPGGHLLWTDTFPASDLDELHETVKQVGFEVIKEEDIRDNVLASLSAQEKENNNLIQRIVPWYLRKISYHFAGFEGTYINSLLQSGSFTYPHLVMQKV